MKKRLLFMFTAALCTVTAFGSLYEIGDFAYTPNGRFRITSENLLTNGDFSDGLNGWYSLSGLALSTDTFEVSYDDEIGANKITTLYSDIVTSNYYKSGCFYQAITLDENKTYLCSYKVNSFTTPRNCANGFYGRNYNHQSFDIISDIDDIPNVQSDYGDVLDHIFEYTTLPAAWYTQNMDYTADSSVVVMVNFFNLVVDDSYADFGIYEATQVGDDRKAEDFIKLIDFFLDDEDFQDAGEEEREMLTEARSDLEGIVGTNVSISELDDILVNLQDAEEGPLALFLDANSADLSGYYTNFTFDDVSSMSAGKGAASGWSTDMGGRWGISEATNNLETNYAFASINANYILPAGNYYQSAALPAGKYLYVIQAIQYKYYQDGSGSSNNYTSADYNSTFEGMYYFINEDTVQLDSVKGDFAYYYMNVFEVAEDGEQTIGFKYDSTQTCNTAATYEGNSGGGRVGFDNVYLRMVGKTAAQVEAYFLQETMAASQAALQEIIDSAEAIVVLDKYIFGKDDLNDSIATAKTILETLTESTQENIDYVDLQTDNLEDAISDYYTINVEYVTLGEDIETCEEDYADEARTSGKETFRSAIDVATAYYESVTAESRDSAELVAQDSVLMAARQTYMIANASLTSWAEINMTNPSFTTGGYTGWTQDGTTGNGAWKFSTSMSDFEDGACAYYNRGYSAYDTKYMYQDVDITEAGAGVYLYTAEFISNNSYQSTDSAETYVRMFINEDSLFIWTQGLEDKSQTYPGGVDRFYIFSYVEDVNDLTVPGYVTVGVYKFGGSTDYQYYTANLLYFSSSHLYYVGSIADYEASITGVKVDDTSVKTGDIYNLSGVKVRTNGSLNGLEKGIYIMNGKKYVVK